MFVFYKSQVTKYYNKAIYLFLTTHTSVLLNLNIHIERLLRRQEQQFIAPLLWRQCAVMLGAVCCSAADWRSRTDSVCRLLPLVLIVLLELQRQSVLSLD